MYTIKGTIKNGMILPKEPLGNREGEEVLITFEWDREWAEIEAEMKARDLADDRAEGRL